MRAKNYAKQAKHGKVQGIDVIILDQDTSPPSSPTFNSHKRKKSNKNEDNEMRSDTDFLSKLPDDILVYIVSFVDVKTAGRTSLLSKRWRYVWTHITHLDFSYHNPSYPSTCGPFCIWVNKVTDAHRAPYLNSMRIYFPLIRGHIYKGMDHGMGFQLYLYVHKWIKFGLRKKVANLEFNLANVQYPEKGCSGFSHKYMNHPDLSHFKTNWKSPHLKSLHLEALCIDGPLVEKVLSNCLNLEQLIVKSCAFKSFNLQATGASFLYLWSNAFRNMELNNSKITVSSPKLKHLEFSGCNVDLFKISAPKLSSLVLIPSSETRTMLEVEYTSVPSLMDVTFVALYCFRNFNSSDFPSYKLEKLTLSWDESSKIRIGLCEVLISLIDTCPLLHTLKLEASTHTILGILKSE